jgi:GIY-YIG catalytic domain
MNQEQLAAADALLRPTRLWSRAEVLARPSPVPAASGIYAWYFTPLTIVDGGGCVEMDGRRLLYVGISPKPPPANGAPPSRQQLRSRLRQHYAGNAAGSTLRLTLGCLLAGELGLQLRRVRSGQRLTFADGEEVLSAWMTTHAVVCWMTHPRPWELEQALVARLDLPLNLHGNAHHRFYPRLRGVRAAAKATARALPVWTPTAGTGSLPTDEPPSAERA